MQFTATKSLVRGYFYREFLPSHLTAEQLSRAEFLVLLGDDDLERLELEDLDIPGKHIHSVENDRAVFARQVRRNNNNESPVNLYFRSLSEVINDYLHSNRRLQVFNLDICGSYLTAIDPVMTRILRFARRSPRTIIATYTNVGRDREQLREGLKSLAICHWVAPAATERTMSALVNRYMAAGLSREVSVNMALRQLFWLRSNLEHVLLSGVTSGVLRSEAAANYLSWMELCWRQTARAAPPSVSYTDWLQVVDTQSLPTAPTGRVFNLCIREVNLVTYAANRSFYHNGWFTLYGHTSRMSLKQWLEHGLQALIANPLLFAANGASQLSWYDTTGGLRYDLQRIWKGKGLEDACRHLPIPETSIALMALDTQPLPSEQAVVDRVSVAPEASQRQLIRKLALEGMNTDQIMASLTGPMPPRASVTALIASARRKR